MYSDAGHDLSEPSPRQVSFDEPRHAGSERRAIFAVLFRGFMVIVAIAGLNRLLTAQHPAHYAIGGACVLLGLTPVTLLGFRRIRRLIGIRRINRGHCPVCNYAMTFSTGRCPECGVDPFEW
jgi:hypothetical protein